VYKDSQGNTPLLACVQEAKKRLVERERGQGYLGIDGLPEFTRLTRELLFCPDGDAASHEALSSGRAVTAQTPGGTGALRVAADFVRTNLPKATMWCSKPTWVNHPKVFAAAGLTIEGYTYGDDSGRELDFDGMCAALAAIPAGDVVCLHACCHNPSGIDPTPEQWRKVGDIVYERGLLPLFDFAYEGFGDGLSEDGRGVAEFCRPGREMLICSSFSKNFGLYSERVGALTLVAGEAGAARAGLSQIKACIRANYSNPPRHGAAIVAEVLDDADLRRQWESELAEMRSRINGMRKLFVQAMKARGVDRDFSFIERQRGMFSFSGLTPEQVEELRDKHSIYIVRNGRINVAGMTEANMDRLCDAIASVL
jgi:aspartate/tyrosine/aromatic aminotransferase